MRIWCAFFLVIILASCSPEIPPEPVSQKDDAMSKIDEITESVPIAENEKEIDEKQVSREKTVLHVLSEDWKVLIELKEFDDIDSGNLLSSRVLYQERKKDNMIITGFLEKVAATNDSESCWKYYLPSTKRYLKEKAYLKESELVLGASDIAKQERKSAFLSIYSLYLPDLPDYKKPEHKSVNAYAWYKGYCLDLHLSQFPFEGNMQKFYEIIDSVEFLTINDVKELDGAFVVTPIDAN